MDKEKILEYCYRLMADMLMAERCFNCEKILSEKFANDDDIIHSEFFELARQSFLYTGTIILCKAFEDISEKNKPFSIKQILQWVKCTVKMTKAQKGQLKKLECEYGKKKAIYQLKNLRDKFYAHNDRISPDDLVEKVSLTRAKKLELIDFALKVLSFAISVCKDEPYCCYMDKDESSLRLKLVLEDLDQYHHVIIPQIREQIRGVDNAKPTP